ncbi:MAG TPA: helix-turn-helix domain-containing protein [Phenylobacterium sp.]
MSSKTESPEPAAVSGLETGPRVSIYLPDVALRAYVTFYYFVTAIRPLEDFLYPEWGNVRFAVEGDWRLTMDGYGTEPQVDTLFGPTDRCGAVTTTGGRVVGFGMTPLGWNRLIGADADLMVNRARPLGDDLGPSWREVSAALAADTSDAQGVARFDALLNDLAARRPPVASALVAVDQALRTHPATVPEFAAAAGVAPRTLHRLCLRLFGFAPKRLLRRQRFLDTLGQVRTAVGDPLGGALDPAYFDQAHFYRDFRDFMGMSPRAYFTASRALMGRAAAAQTASGVTLSFRLPPPA